LAHYVQNVWTNQVTPVDKAHMDVIEAGITEAADLYYLGDWVAGTYKEGDIVVYNGVAYVAVRQTTQTPVPWAAGQASLSYGTTLPSNPVDGQEAVLVDNPTNPAYQWRFRYNAGHSADAYKWEFLGGAPYLIRAPDYAPPGAGAYYNDTAAGATITAPRAGIYICESKANLGAVSTNNSAYVGFAYDQSGTRVGQPALVGDESSWAFMTTQTFAAGATLQNCFYLGAGTGTFNRRYLSILPQRVS